MDPLVPPLRMVLVVQIINLQAVVESKSILVVSSVNDGADWTSSHDNHLLGVEWHVTLFKRIVCLCEPHFLVISCVSLTQLSNAESLVKDLLYVGVRAHKHTCDLLNKVAQERITCLCKRLYRNLLSDQSKVDICIQELWRLCSKFIDWTLKILAE